jgi:hypothetical protein
LTNRRPYYEENEFSPFCSTLWHSFYKLPIDVIPDAEYLKIEFIRKTFFKDSWFEVYDFVEFLVNLDFDAIDTKEFIRALNITLEKEFAGYRIINKKVSPISNEMEVDEIEKAIDQTIPFSSFRGANIHLTKALEKISDKKNPDYANSIKESISAVEAICRVLSGESTLGKALQSLETKGIKINNQLKNAFEKLYAFTNNTESGIRHAIIDNFKNPDFEEAKYLLISCSAFINFLIGKCNTQGIKIV